MTCDILIRSYRKDLEWLSLCLKSVIASCRGFRSVVVIVPVSTRPWLRRFPDIGRMARIEFCTDFRDDYLGQQVTKLRADQFTDADFISHVDSDCIFTRPTSPHDLITDGRPHIHMRAYEQLGRHWPWQKPTEEFCGWHVKHDFMQRPPFTFPRWLYAAVREHAVATHSVDIERYVLSRQPRGFSEFNVLGAYAQARHSSDFLWFEENVETPELPPCRWYWSWGGLDPRTRGEIESIIDSAGGAS